MASPAEIHRLPLSSRVVKKEQVGISNPLIDFFRGFVLNQRIVERSSYFQVVRLGTCIAELEPDNGAGAREGSLLFNDEIRAGSSSFVNSSS
jgi:hypothetical protein